MGLSVNDILVGPRTWLSSRYGEDAVDDATSGVPVRLFKVLLACDEGGHFRVWTGATAGAGDLFYITSITWYPAQIDFGPGGIRIPYLSYDWGADPEGDSSGPYGQGRGPAGGTTSFGINPSQDFRSLATIVYSLDD